MKTYHLTGKPPYYTNCFVLTDDAGNAVRIDCSADVAKVKQILSNDRCELRAILLTHGHADHRETLTETVAEFGCPVWLGKEDAEFYGIENTNAYTDGGTLSFGEITLHTLFTPGHTPGGYVLYCADMMFAGDTLFAGSIGRTDMPGGDYDTLMKSLEKIAEKTAADYRVFPGHARFTTFSQEKTTNYYLLKAMGK